MKSFYFVACTAYLILANVVIANEADKMDRIAQLIRDQTTCASFYLANDKKEEIKHLNSLKERAVRWSKVLFMQSQVKAEQTIDKRVSEDATKYAAAFTDKKRMKDFDQPCLALNPAYKNHMVTVKPLTGEVAIIPFEAMETVYLLKLKVERKMNYTANKWNLVFSGKKLDDNKILGDYSLKDNDVVYLIVRN